MVLSFLANSLFSVLWAPAGCLECVLVLSVGCSCCALVRCLSSLSVAFHILDQCAG